MKIHLLQNTNVHHRGASGPNEGFHINVAVSDIPTKLSPINVMAFGANVLGVHYGIDGIIVIKLK
jgi:hypothetical protein